MSASNTAIGIVVIMFGAAVFLYSMTFPGPAEHMPGPSLFPMILAVLLSLCGAILTGKGIRAGERVFSLDFKKWRGRGLQNSLVILGSAVFYILFSGLFGFLLTSFAVLFADMRWLGVRLRNCLLAAAGTTLFIYIVFGKILFVALPVGWLGF